MALGALHTPLLEAALVFKVPRHRLSCRAQYSTKHSVLYADQTVWLLRSGGTVDLQEVENKTFSLAAESLRSIPVMRRTGERAGASVGALEGVRHGNRAGWGEYRLTE